MLVRRLTMLPIECVVRGYLAGSGWKDYQATGAVCGTRCPPGLREADRLPEPIFTPATKATEGHDENITARAGGCWSAPRPLAEARAASRSRSTSAAAGVRRRRAASSWPTPSSSSGSTPPAGWCWATRC